MFLICQDESKRLWAFAVGAYWLTIATFYVLWKSYKHVILLRTQDQSSLTAKPEQYAVLVRDIPSPLTGSIAQEVEDYFRSLHPGTYESSIIVTNMSKVNLDLNLSMLELFWYSFKCQFAFYLFLFFSFSASVLALLIYLSPLRLIPSFICPFSKIFNSCPDAILHYFSLCLLSLCRSRDFGHSLLLFTVLDVSVVAQINAGSP